VDIIEPLLAYHLSAGVDFVIATDNGSDDGTSEVLRAYADQGFVHLIQEPGRDMRQGDWVTRMARLAASKFDADWVIHGDADEFYWPRGSSLKEVLDAIPQEFGVVRTFVRTFLLRPDGDPFFAERMTARLATQAPINDPSSIFRPGAKVIHRGDPKILLGDGTHAVHGSLLTLLPTWYPIELLHFPFRTVAQTEKKFVNAWNVWCRNPNRPPPHYYAKAYSAIQAGRVGDFIQSLTIDAEMLALGLANNSLVLDNRLRDVLRKLKAADGYDVAPGGASIEPPDALEQVRYAVDTAVLTEADVARMHRRVDELEARL